MPTSDLLRTCRAAAFRLTVREALRRGVQASAVALGIAASVSFIALIVPVGIPLWWMLGAACVIGVLVTLLSAAFRPIRTRMASQLLDRHLALQERVSTALELISNPSATAPLQVRAVADAVRHLPGIDLRRVCPLIAVRELRVVLLLVGLVILANVGLRGLTFPGTPAREVARRIQEEGNRLAQVAQTLQMRARAERLPQTRRSTTRLQELGIRLQRDRLDRAGALARISDLAQQTDRARREIMTRLEQARPARRPETPVPPNALRQEALDRQIKQLRELSSRLNEDLSAADQQTRERLAAMMNAGQEGPDEVQQQLKQAREQLQRGNVPQAGQAVGEALRNLEALRALTGDEAGLEAVQRQLQQSAGNIGSLGPQSAPQTAERTLPEQTPPSAPGPLPPSPEGSEPAPPPQGPNRGVLPGYGEIADKLGAPSARLQGPKSPTKLHSEPGEGTMSRSEIVGAARPGISRVPVRLITPTAVSDADRYMERALIPAHYRSIVRRYFQRLVQLR